MYAITTTPWQYSCVCHSRARLPLSRSFAGAFMGLRPDRAGMKMGHASAASGDIFTTEGRVRMLYLARTRNPNPAPGRGKRSGTAACGRPEPFGFAQSILREGSRRGRSSFPLDYARGFGQLRSASARQCSRGACPEERSDERAQDGKSRFARQPVAPASSWRA